MRTLLTILSLVAVLGFAAALRFIDLDVNPGGLFRDEAGEALSAQRIVGDPGYRPVFLPQGGGREALFAYAVAVGFGLFGESVLVLRSVAAAIGVAGVAAIWLAVRRFGNAAAWLAASWAAGSLWLICVSRNGMLNSIVPLFAALAVAAVLRWQQRSTPTSAILAGSALAVATLYTYQPLKLLPLVILIWLAWLWRVNRPVVDALRPTFLATGISFLIVAAPMLVYAISDPGNYFQRPASVSALADPSANLVSHWLRTLGMFAIAGDPNPRHNVDALPLLGLPLAAVALVGIVRLWRRRADPAHALVLWSLPIFLLPPMLATEGPPPHFLRALGLAVPVSITVALGALALSDWAAARMGPPAARGVVAAVAVGLLAIGVASGRTYLSRPVVDRYDAYSYDVVAMVELAGPQDLLLLDPPDARVADFLSSGRLQVAAPGIRVTLPSDGRVLALTIRDLSRSVGAAGAERAAAVARNPLGEPTVWAVGTLPP
ncbi:MAG TPA: glycosyltransferase family 39 protein [Candidatus Limnocylindria bacterium]|nr:glycosyltransferase family 39 protein [Candidatus Limnocylindria bacterium]